MIPLIGTLWRDYQYCCPAAGAITNLLGADGDGVINDHIALRGATMPGCDINALAQVFLTKGWLPSRVSDTFADQHLTETHHTPPAPYLPRFFMSQLHLDDIPDRCLLRQHLQPAGTDRTS